MNRKSIRLVVRTALILLSVGYVHALQAQETYYAKVPLDPAHTPVAEELRGEIIKRAFTASSSSVYPGTKRDYWIYVPRDYTPEKPACLFVCCDGVAFNAPIVFDNLIPKGDMPVTIGVFVAPGVLYNEKNEAIHYTRQYEYDTMDDSFVRFLTDELLPDVERQMTSDGRAIRLSRDGNDHAIAGCSSGGICAFNAAWQRPDVFSRVLSCCGSFAALHGGHEFHVLVRKTEPKPIRVFLDAGMLDVALPPIGNLYEANITMESALRYAGYEVDHAWHQSGHDLTHAMQSFPDLMRWLWKGWPERILSSPSNNQLLKKILDSTSVWIPIELPACPYHTLAAGSNGDVYTANDAGDVYCISDDKAPVVKFRIAEGEKLLTSKAGGIYTADNKGNIYLYVNNKKRTVARNLNGIAGATVSADGKLYAAQRLPKNERAIWLIGEDGKKTLVDKHQHGGCQLAFSANNSLMACNEEHSHWLYFYRVREDGTLADSSRYCWLHNVDNSDYDAMGSLTFDASNDLYAATKAGIQVSEITGLGLVLAILTPPQGKPVAVCFGGKDKNCLFTISGDKIYRRKMAVHGF